MLSITYGIPPNRLGEFFTSSEYSELSAFYAINPWGPTRDNIHSSQILAMLYNINRGRQQEAKAPADFMFKHAEQQRRDSSQTILDTMRALAERKPA